MQSEGLIEQYQDEDNVELRTQFRSLIALAFVPEDDIVGAFDRLQEDMAEISEPKFNYVEDNFVRRRRRGRGHMAPMFPPNKWNCYERTLGDQPRTTNSCEAWHRRLNTLVGRPHPSLYHVLQRIQKEVVDVLIAQPPILTKSGITILTSRLANRSWIWKPRSAKTISSGFKRSSIPHFSTSARSLIEPP